MKPGWKTWTAEIDQLVALGKSNGTLASDFAATKSFNGIKLLSQIQELKKIVGPGALPKVTTSRIPTPPTVSKATPTQTLLQQFRKLSGVEKTRCWNLNQKALIEEGILEANAFKAAALAIVQAPADDNADLVSEFKRLKGAPKQAFWKKHHAEICAAADAINSENRKLKAKS